MSDDRTSALLGRDAKSAPLGRDANSAPLGRETTSTPVGYEANSSSDGRDTNPADRPVSIGRIPLKQMRIKRPETEGEKPTNPMNGLVPYLDLFCRLSNLELARLAHVDIELVAELRSQVIAIDESLAAYTDLLPRLTDNELVRLTGATPKTIRFWRLCQPQIPVEAVAAAMRGAPPPQGGLVARACRIAAGDAEPDTHVEDPTPPEPSPSDSGLHDAEPHRIQDVVSALMDFSGDPFPGFGPDDGPRAADIERSTMPASEGELRARNMSE